MLTFYIPLDAHTLTLWDKWSRFGWHADCLYIFTLTLHSVLIMDITTKEILIYWQENQASAYFMFVMYRDEGDFITALNWQEYHAYCHKCIITNRQKAGI